MFKVRYQEGTDVKPRSIYDISKNPWKFIDSGTKLELELLTFLSYDLKKLVKNELDLVVVNPHGIHKPSSFTRAPSRIYLSDVTPVNS